MRQKIQKAKLKKKRLQAKSQLSQRIPLDLPEEEMKKLAGKTVRRGEDDYLIVVLGVETGLCGKYWGGLDNSSRRRRRKEQEKREISANSEEDGDSMMRTDGFANEQNPKAPKAGGQV